MKSNLRFILKHKLITLIVIAAITAGGYFIVKKINNGKSSISYTTAAIEKGLLISSIAGTGQVSASNQVDIKAKVSGSLLALNVKNGQKIGVGELIATIDSRSAAFSVNQARLALENAKLDLEKLQSSADALTLLQAQNAVIDARDALDKLQRSQPANLTNAEGSVTDAENNLRQSYENGYNAVANAFLDLPDIMTGLNTILSSNEIQDAEAPVNNASNDQALINSFLTTDWDSQNYFENLINQALADYQALKNTYQTVFDAYKKTSRYAEPKIIDSLLSSTENLSRKTSDLVKDEKNLIDYWIDYRTTKKLRVYPTVSAYQTDLNSYTSKVNSHLSNLISSQSSIDNSQDAVTKAENDLTELKINQPRDLAAAQRSLEEKQQKLSDLQTGPTGLEIKTQQQTVAQKQNDLYETQQNYADYFIRAPFDGQVAEVDAAKGDNISSGTLIATLISEQKIAEITLNEIDAAQVKTGQKATLSFDAVPDLSLTGKVVEVDTLGAVSQGVVSYGVKVAFDVQDERIKPGMSVSVNIIIASKADVLLVPLSAVKSLAQGSYVEVLVDGQPQRKTVEIGSSNDTLVEIVAGLDQGEEIITQTISNGTNSSSNSNSSAGQNRSFGGGFGGELRVLR